MNRHNWESHHFLHTAVFYHQCHVNNTTLTWCCNNRHASAETVKRCRDLKHSNIENINFVPVRVALSCCCCFFGENEASGDERTDLNEAFARASIKAAAQVVLCLCWKGELRSVLMCHQALWQDVWSLSRHTEAFWDCLHRWDNRMPFGQQKRVS